MEALKEIIEKKEEDIIYSYEYFPSTENKNLRWHIDVIGEYKINKKIGDTKYPLLNFRLADVLSGCGSLMMHNYYCYPELNREEKDKEGIKEIVATIYRDLVKNGVGAIFTTLGENYYKNRIGNGGYMFMIENIFGFTSVLEYKNYRHGGAKQRLYNKFL